MYVPSSEGIGTLTLPLPQASVPLPPEPKGEGHTRLRVRGWESPNSDDWRKSLALCLLCSFYYLREKTTFKSVVACGQVNGDEDPAEEHEDEYGFDHRVGRVLSVSPVVGIGTPPPL